MSNVKRKNVCLSALLVSISLLPRCAIAATANFDDLPLAPHSYWDGSALDGNPEQDPNGENSSGYYSSFISGGAKFFNRYNSDFASWDGFAYSNMTDATTSGYGNQYSAFTGTGNDPGADNYGLAYGYLDQHANVNQSFAFNPLDAGQLQLLPHFDVPAGQRIASAYFTNTTYAGIAMRDGDSFAKKFGPSDFFELSVFGTDATGTPLGKEVDFYLASQGEIVNQWTLVNLSSLAAATRLYFNLASSDVGIFGMNTPSYFAIDDIQFASAAWKPGDFNLDGHVDSRDVTAMLAALTNLNAYQHGSNSQSETLADADLETIADLNGDGKITNGDLQSLLNLLKGGGGSTSVPEPPACLLMLSAMAVWLASARRADNRSRV
jgi:hypothetical protein